MHICGNFFPIVFNSVFRLMNQSLKRANELRNRSVLQTNLPYRQHGTSFISPQTCQSVVHYRVRNHFCPQDNNFSFLTLNYFTLITLLNISNFLIKFLNVSYLTQNIFNTRFFSMTNTIVTDRYLFVTRNAFRKSHSTIHCFHKFISDTIY